MNILFVISSLGSGGAERVMSIMANYWCEKNYTITIVTLSECGEDFYLLNSKIQRIGLNLRSNSNSIFFGISNNISRSLSLRRTIKKCKPSCVISFVDTINVLTLVSTLGLRIPVIVSERNDPKYYKIGKFWSFLRTITYPFASRIVVQTTNVAKWVQRHIPLGRIEIIHNPIDVTKLQKLNEHNFESEYLILAVGRLSKQKGFDILVDAFARIAADFDNWNIVICGEGGERSFLEGLINSKGLSKRITLPGIVRNPMHTYSKAQIFVLSSRYEGFPNVLLEAMVAGKAVISTDCNSGPSEIITNYHDGILVRSEDSEELANALMTLMGNAILRKELALNGQYAKHRFGQEKIMVKWENLVKDVVKM